MQEFNKEILETMEMEVAKIKSVYDICTYCKEGNNLANKEYLKKYPTHKDLLSIFEHAISVIEYNIINDYKKHIVENEPELSPKSNIRNSLPFFAVRT